MGCGHCGPTGSTLTLCSRCGKAQRQPGIPVFSSALRSSGSSSPPPPRGLLPLTAHSRGMLKMGRGRRLSLPTWPSAPWVDPICASQLLPSKIHRQQNCLGYVRNSTSWTKATAASPPQGPRACPSPAASPSASDLCPRPAPGRPVCSPQRPSCLFYRVTRDIAVRLLSPDSRCDMLAIHLSHGGHSLQSCLLWGRCPPWGWTPAYPSCRSLEGIWVASNLGPL